MEIGVYKGGDLMLFNNVFNNVEIYGIDVTLKLLRKNTVQDCKNVHLFTKDAYTIETVNEFKNIEFDIIIDDGPHTKESMIFFAENYSSLLKKDGIMIIEDIQSIDWYPEIQNSFPKHFEVKLVDLRYNKNRYDDILIIAKHKC